jgi:protein-S-isoprenylcysteine O-methyltransferase Ste14
MLTSILNSIGFWNAWILMGIFLVQLLILLILRKPESKRSHVPNEVRRSGFEKYIGNLANLIWLFLLDYSIFLPLSLGTIWFYIGLSVYGLGVLILLFSTYIFIHTTGDKLIEIGVYRFSRHPMYLATFLICLGSGIAAMSYSFIVMSILLVLCLHCEALVEEKYCLKIYNDIYKEYMNKVPRWLGIPCK